MEATYLLLANLLAIFHLGCMVLFLVLIPFSVRGRLSSNLSRGFLWLWVTGKIASFYILGACIFTIAEQKLRLVATGATYTGGYIEYYSEWLGVYLTPPTVEGLVVTPLAVVILSELWWYMQRRSVKTV